MEFTCSTFLLPFFVIQYFTGYHQIVEAVMKNVVVLLGEDVEFQCDIPFESSDDILWARHSSNYHSFIIYPKSENITDLKFNVNFQENSTTLFIKTDNLTNADSYYCFNRIFYLTDSADLVIIEKLPECSYFEETVIENHILGIYCKVNVSGNWIPAFRCTTMDGDNLITFHPQPQFKSISSYSVEGIVLVTISEIVIEVNVTASYRNNKEQITCDTYNWTYVGLYYEPYAPVIKAINMPSFPYSWTSSPANILFGPKFVNITNNFYDLVCTSIGNPTPTYRWVIINNRNIQGPVLHKSLFKEIGSYDVTCVAGNLINGVPFSDQTSLSVNITQLIEPPADGEVADPFTVGGLVGSLCTILVMDIFAGIAFIVYKLKW